MRSLYSMRPSRIPNFGLVTKSIAPNSKARKVMSEWRSVKDETITTGIGRKRIKRSKKSSPSMRGISTSKVNTSGAYCLISSLAIKGSGAVATTSIRSEERRVGKECRAEGRTYDQREHKHKIT